MPIDNHRYHGVETPSSNRHNELFWNEQKHINFRTEAARARKFPVICTCSYLCNTDTRQPWDCFLGAGNTLFIIERRGLI